jgi:hypothetical protein
MKTCRFRALCLGAALSFAASSVLPDDFNPPPWRGNRGSTYERWDFLTDDRAPAPDEYRNPWGEPEAAVAPNPALPEAWQPLVGNRQGIWSLSGAIALYIPNTPWDYTKTVWLQMTWRDTPGFEVTGPTLGTIDPAGTGWPLVLQSSEILPDGFCHCLYVGHVIPNPPWEIIVIAGNIDVDQIVVDTNCPEPQTYALCAGLGLLGFAFWRRHHA